MTWPRYLFVSGIGAKSKNLTLTDIQKTITEYLIYKE